MKQKLPVQPRTFITGGGSGLGRELALQLARRRARLLIGDIDPQQGQETVELARQAGAIAEFISCDVGKSADVLNATRQMTRLWGGTDLLVNNAGVAVGGTVGDISLKDWKWIMQINLWGVVHGCHHFAPAMKQAGRGWILNVASNAGIASLPEMGPYNVTKAGVISLSETLATELGAHGITVTALCPTFFQTNLMDSFRSSHDRQRAMAEWFFKRSSMTVQQVATTALQDLERGRLYSIPQKDGKLSWATKRLHPGLYFKQVGSFYKSGLYGKIAG